MTPRYQEIPQSKIPAGTTKDSALYHQDMNKYLYGRLMEDTEKK